VNKTKFNLEKATNIVVILAIIMVAGVIVKRYAFDSSDAPQKIEVGKVVSIPNINWGQNEQTIIISVKQDCSFCSLSASFISQIVDEASKQNVKTEIVSSDSEVDIKEYLAQMKLPELKSHQIGLRDSGFLASPTFLFVDRDGIVKDMWIGALNDENIQIVRNKLVTFVTANVNRKISDNSDEKNENGIYSNELNNLLENDSDVLVIDIDSREEYKNLHISNAKNIPSDEIISRQREIPKNKQVIVYGRCSRDSRSRFAQAQLAKLAYSNTVFLSGGLKGWQEVGFSVEKNLATNE
jgi:rhodanese-related sulfurtransferase